MARGKRHYVTPVSAKREINRRGTCHLLCQHLKHLMIKRIMIVSIINYECNISIGMKLWNFSNHRYFWHKINSDDPNINKKQWIQSDVLWPWLFRFICNKKVSLSIICACQRRNTCIINMQMANRVYWVFSVLSSQALR